MKTFKFGKYRGSDLQDIANNDPSYFKWALKNVEGFREYAAGIKPFDAKRSVPIRSACGNGYIKNEGLPRPGQRHFVSKRERYVDPNPMPADAGEDVVDDAGNVIGVRGYTKFNSDDWVATTVYPDGSKNIHCGGPCGNLYCDEFGNT